MVDSGNGEFRQPWIRGFEERGFEERGFGGAGYRRGTLTLSGRRPAETIQTPAYLPARHILGKA
jgi:hypothetical protein